MKTKLRVLPVLLMLLSVTATPRAQGQELNDLAFYARCYGHLTGKALPLNHPLRAGLKAGTVNALAKCKELLAKGLLDPVTGEADDSDSEALDVLRTMFAFHRTWFAFIDFQHMQSYSLNGTTDMWDASAPALALTSLMLAQGANKEDYSKILSGTKNYFPIRVPDTYLNTVGGNKPHYLPSRGEAEYGTNKNSLPWITTRSTTKGMFKSDGTGSEIMVITPVTVGELVGIKPDDRNTTILDYHPHIIQYTQGQYSFANYGENVAVQGMKSNFNAFRHLGGGLLGSTPYMLLNWGHPPGQVVDGALKVPRRWVQSTFESLLCKEFPILRETDVASFLDLSTNPNKANFRAATSCLQCHATFDQMALVGRNFMVSNSDYRGYTDVATGYNVKLAHLMGETNVTTADSGWPSVGDNNYRKQTPNGRIYFREFSGKLVNQSVTGIAAAGNALSTSPDLYQCAAKRYFQYFTGYNVPLYDRGDPRFSKSLAQITPQERQLRAYIEDLGAQLKQHQSTKQLVETILSSPYYRDLKYEPAGVP